jgi:hypothetical protein
MSRTLSGISFRRSLAFTLTTMRDNVLVSVNERDMAHNLKWGEAWRQIRFALSRGSRPSLRSYGGQVAVSGISFRRLTRVAAPLAETRSLPRTIMGRHDRAFS